MNTKRKRRLTASEIDGVRAWFENSGQGMKPSIRQIARRYGVNQPSVVKSLGGWEGIQRGRPVPPPKFKPKFIDIEDKRINKIEAFTEDVKL